MSKIKSFFQSIQKPFQDPINLIKNVAVDVHHEIIQKPFQGLSRKLPHQVDNSKLEIPVLNVLGMNSMGVLSPRESWGLNSL